MPEIIDSLVTQLEYTADTKVIDKADKKLKQLEKQSEATAKATDELADEQINLKSKLQDTAEAEQKLRREQSKLRKEIKATKKPTDDQRKALAKVDAELDETTQNTRKYRNELARLGITQAKIAKQQRAEAKQLARLSKARGRAAGGLAGSARASSALQAKGQSLAARQQASVASESRSSARETAAFFKRKQASEVAARAKAEASKGPGGIAGVAAAAGPVGAALGGVATAATAAGLAIGTVIQTGAEMEGLRARLKTVEGSVEAAGAAFSLLRDIAKTTPFELQDVTTAYVRLKSLGIQPTQASLEAFGNVAAAQGKPLIDFVEAVGDAATGEFERLKEFGIKASSQGEQVAFTFKGITTRVGKNAKEINAFLEGLGKTEFAGAMADQMNTFGGLVSNLKDTWTGFLDEIAKLGVLDEAKLLLKELSGTMGDDLVPIIADLMIAALQQLREIFVDLRDGGGGLKGMLESVSEAVELLGTLLAPFLLVWKAFVVVFQHVFEAGGFLVGLINNLFEAIGRLLEPLGELVGEWDGLNAAWEMAKDFGGSVLSTIDGVTTSLFNQAEAIAVVKGSLADLQEQIGKDVKKLTDAQLQELLQAGGAAGAEADKEIKRRVKQREESDKKEESAQKKDKSKKEKAGRAGKVAERFDKLSDTQLAAFATDPNVSKKLRDKAEKEQIRRDKKKTKKGKAAGKKARGQTLAADIEKQIAKNARELAQADAARALRAGKIKPKDLAGFEQKRFKERKERMSSKFQETGQLPAGIAQDVRQVAAIPSINDLAGRTAAPVISTTVNNFDFHGNEFNAIVEGGTFEGTPQGFATASAGELRKQTSRLLGESVPNFRSNEIR